MEKGGRCYLATPQTRFHRHLLDFIDDHPIFLRIDSYISSMDRDCTSTCSPSYIPYNFTGTYTVYCGGNFRPVFKEKVTPSKSRGRRGFDEPVVYVWCLEEKKNDKPKYNFNRSLYERRNRPMRQRQK